MRIWKEAILLAVAFAAAGAWAVEPEEAVEKPPVKVGDRWVYQLVDLWGNKKKDKTEYVVSAANADIVEMRRTVLESENAAEVGKPADEKWDWNTGVLMSLVASGDFRYFDFPLKVGKKWDYKYRRTSSASGPGIDWEVSAEVLGWEDVTVPAGRFRALHIKHSGGWHRVDGKGDGTLRMNVWYAPGAHRYIVQEYEDWVGTRSYNRTRRELVEFRLAE